MKIEKIKSMTCNNSDECTKNLVEKLEGKFGCILMARNKNDEVSGYITIFHEAGKHKVICVLYDNDEKPNKKHQTTFKKLKPFPTESELKKAI